MMSSSVLVIAPHLFTKKHSIRHCLRRSYLNRSFMADNANDDTDQYLPDETRQFTQDEQVTDQAALREGRVSIGDRSEKSLRRSSGKTDSSGSSSAGASHYTLCDLCPADFSPVSYCRPVEIMAENDTLRCLLKDAEGHCVLGLKEVQEQANFRIREAEQRADQRVQEADRRVREADERAEECVREADERADRRVREVDERADRHVQGAEERAGQLLKTFLVLLTFDLPHCSI